MPMGKTLYICTCLDSKEAILTFYFEVYAVISRRWERNTQFLFFAN
jgi:hypothetical protein